MKKKDSNLICFLDGKPIEKEAFIAFLHMKNTDQSKAIIKLLNTRNNNKPFDVFNPKASLPIYDVRYRLHWDSMKLYSYYSALSAVSTADSLLYIFSEKLHEIGAVNLVKLVPGFKKENVLLADNCKDISKVSMSAIVRTMIQRTNTDFRIRKACFDILPALADRNWGAL